MPANKSTFLKYSEDAVKAAVKDVRLKRISIRAAAKKYGVPRTTLKYKLDGTTPMERKMGPPSTLTQKEEVQLVKWAENMAKAGFPITVEQLCISVERYVKEMKRDSPFKDGRPGRTWVIGFLQRNPSISRRVSQNLTVSRAAVTREKNVTESMLSNGFKKCGLYPWNPQAIEVPGQGLSKKHDEYDSTDMKIRHLKRGLHFLNTMIEREKLNVFEASSETWCGDPLDTSLFKLWKKTKMDLEELSSETETRDVGNNIFPNISQFPADKGNNDASVTDMELIYDLPEAGFCDVEKNVSTSMLPSDIASEFVVDGSYINESPVPDMDNIFEDLTQAKASTSHHDGSHGEHSQNHGNIEGTSQGILSPFKRHFFFLRCKKTRKEKLEKKECQQLCPETSVKNISKLKRKKKEELEWLKTERALKRRIKKEENKRMIQNKAQRLKNNKIKRVSNIASDSSDSSVEVSSGESVLSEPSENETPTNLSRKPVLKEINEYVIFEYDWQYFPGKIIDVAEATATISSMIKCGQLCGPRDLMCWNTSGSLCNRT